MPNKMAHGLALYDQANVNPNRGWPRWWATRETVARTLADFRRRGLRDTAHHQVLIRNAEQLADVCRERGHRGQMTRPGGT